MCCYESQTVPVACGEEAVTLTSASVPTLLLEIEYLLLLVAEFGFIFQNEV